METLNIILDATLQILWNFRIVVAVFMLLLAGSHLAQFAHQTTAAHGTPSSSAGSNQ